MAVVEHAALVHAEDGALRRERLDRKISLLHLCSLCGLGAAVLNRIRRIGRALFAAKRNDAIRELDGTVHAEAPQRASRNYTALYIYGTKAYCSGARAPPNAGFTRTA